MSMIKIKNFLTFAVFTIIIVTLSLMFVLGEDKKTSNAERRELMQFEEVKNSEDPFGNFETYFLDQFPMRDSFRKLKSFLYIDVLRKNENNGFYKHDGSIISLGEDFDEKKINYTANIMNNVIDRYFDGYDVYYSIIPDKNFYAVKENGYPSSDYEKLFGILDSNVKAEYIDITSELELSDYYITDPHWSQDKIIHVAQLLASTMTTDLSLNPTDGYTENVLEPYYGIQYEQSTFVSSADKLVYLTTDNTENMKMTVLNDRGYPEERPLYNVEKFGSAEPYDVFTDGAWPYMTIENPSANTDKQLVLFRDSFGSSIAPLFAEGYSKVIMIDLRYMFPDAIASFMSTVPKDSDVLFLYSTGLVNGGILRDFMSKR